MALSENQKKWMKRGALIGVALIVTREMYQAFGSRRMYRRSVFEEAQRRAVELSRPLLVLGDPDGGAINHFLGRSWQCGDLCVDPQGCGICQDWTQGQPEQVLATLGADSYVVYDSGLFAKAQDGRALLEQMKRVSGGEVFMADATPWTLTAFFGPGRKRRLLKAPQANDGVMAYKPLFWSPEPGLGRATFETALRGLPEGGRRARALSAGNASYLRI